MTTTKQQPEALQLDAIGAGGVEPLRKPAAAPQAVEAAVPDGWVPCVITYEGQHPEEIAYGPQAMMDRLKKWLDRYFEMRTAPAHPAEGVPDERAAFEAWLGIKPCGAAHDFGWAAWRARAALAATQPAAQGMDALTIVEKLPRYTYGYKSDEWGMNRCLRAYQDNAGTFLMRDEVLAALAAQAKQGG